jgi:hypothetical protein
MIRVWVVAGAMACAAAVLVAWRKRKRGGGEISSEPVSGQWLAEARARGEEHTW